MLRLLSVHQGTVVRPIGVYQLDFFCSGIQSSPGKGMTSWLSIVVFNCEVVTSPFVSWVRCGA